MPRAPRRCPVDGCEQRINGSARYCLEHTKAKAWSGPRTASSISHQTTAWKQARAQVMADATTCALQLSPRCTHRPEEVDLIIGAARGGPITASNMQPVCKPCHALKTRRERDL